MNEDFIRVFNLQNIDVDRTLSFCHHDGKVFKVHIFLNDRVVYCPRCGSAHVIGHGVRKRNIVHSISTSEPCYIVLYSKRFICKDCNKTFIEYNPFSDQRSRLSHKTVIMILDDLRNQSYTFTSVACKYHISPQTAVNTFDRYVSCARLELPEVLCIDEIYAKKLTKHKYCCVLLNFKTKELIDVLPSRHKSELISYFCSIKKEEAEHVKYVVIDMYDNYKEVALKYLFNPVIAVDSFHVIEHLNKAMDQIRLKTMRKFQKGNTKLEQADMYYYMLKKFHYFFKKNYDSIFGKEFYIGKINAKWSKDAVRKYLLEIDDSLRKAYELKQKYQEFNLTARFENCDQEFSDLIDQFMDSEFEEFNTFGKLLKHWRIEIKNSFIIIDNRRLSNGCIEGANSRLKCIIKNANGYRNFRRFRNRCMFVINKHIPLRLYSKKNVK